MLLLEDALYPRRLKATYDPPLVGYVRGDLEFVIEPGIAAVGTRHRTPYGSGRAERRAKDLAAQGLVITSGMATASTPRAIAAQSLPKARRSRYLAPALTSSLPKKTRVSRNRFLGGALIWGISLGTLAAPQNFPICNRILSGTSIGVLVVQAAEYSSGRITARTALEQNRDVFAVSGNVTNTNS